MVGEGRLFFGGGVHSTGVAASCDTLTKSLLLASNRHKSSPGQVHLGNTSYQWALSSVE
jgi:hypothetical protein